VEGILVDGGVYPKARWFGLVGRGPIRKRNAPMRWIRSRWLIIQVTAKPSDALEDNQMIVIRSDAALVSGGGGGDNSQSRLNR
jgi:hypothetical protein